MKVINPDTGFLAYQKIFSNLQANNCHLTVWQNDPLSGERLVSETHLNSFHLESKLLHLDNRGGHRIDARWPVFCYAEDSQLIFKTTIHEIRDNSYTLLIPMEIKFLEDPERSKIKTRMGLDLSNDVLRVKRLNMGIIDPQVGGYMKVKSMSQRSDRDQEYLKHEFEGVSLDEEDKKFADQRESPRARPKNEKWVRIRLPESEDIHRLKLFDLSQGGMGFITFDQDLFPKGNEIYLIGIDGFDLDDPLVGKIMSHRPVDDAQLEWKIGIKFDEGQD